MFATHAAWYNLMWLVLPATLLVNASVLWFVVGRFSLQYHTTQAAHLDQGNASSSSVLHVARRMLPATAVFAFCGGCLLLLNLLTPGLFDGHGECPDPILQTTLAETARRLELGYQCTWCVLNCVVMGTASLAILKLFRVREVRRAIRVYRWLHVLGECDPRKVAVSAWQNAVCINARATQRYRRLFVFWWLRFLFVLLASVPSFLYVLTRNVSYAFQIATN